jgi:hypothetical protein
VTECILCLIAGIRSQQDSVGRNGMVRWIYIGGIVESPRAGAKVISILLNTPHLQKFGSRSWTSSYEHILHRIRLQSEAGQTMYHGSEHTRMPHHEGCAKR